MMLATSLMGGLGGGAAAGAGAAAGGVSALSILSGAASVAGILATIGAGKAQARGYKDQAFGADLEAKNEQAQGLQRQTGMKRELMRILGENTVTAAAAGIDLSQGVAADLAGDAKQKATEELSIDRATTETRRAMYRARAAGYRRMAKEAKRASLWDALGQGFNAAASLGERG